MRRELLPLGQGPGQRGSFSPWRVQQGRIRDGNNIRLITIFTSIEDLFRSQTVLIRLVLPKAEQLSIHFFIGKSNAAPTRGT